MRHTFRKHPKVTTNSFRLKNPSFIIGSNDAGPEYEFTSNRICLVGMNEKNIISLLNHEIAHWAFFAYMTQDEIWDSFWKTINWEFSRAPCCLIEKVARYVAGG